MQDRLRGHFSSGRVARDEGALPSFPTCVVLDSCLHKESNEIISQE